MVSQTTVMNSAPPTNSPSRAIARSVGELGQDILMLGELQAKLAAEDLREAAGSSVKPAVVGVVASGLILGGLPLLLVSIGELLVYFVGIERWIAYCGVAAAALVLGAILAMIAVRKLISLLAIFDRSKQELLQNVHCLKSLLK